MGVYAKFVGKAYWSLLLADAWQVAGAAGGRRNQEELVATGLLRLRYDLFAWYDRWEAAHPGVKLNRVKDLTSSDIGASEAAGMRTKAAETKPLVLHCVDVLGRLGGCLPEDRSALVPAAQALADFSNRIRTVSARPTGPQTQGLVDSLKRFLVLVPHCGIEPTPKMHLALRLVHGTARCGGLGKLGARQPWSARLVA